MCKLSIITINYNNKVGLRRTLKSVTGQTNQDFQYIVIDGGSTDGSVEVIREYEKFIDFWVSEPDKGIYNAMNKGVTHAIGEYCNFLNSGDTYSSVNVVENFINSDSKEDIITGIMKWVRFTNDDIVPIWRTIPMEKITSDILFLKSVSHPSTFILTELLRKNPYDEELRIVSDWKFFMEELIINERSYSTLPFEVADFDNSGISNTNGAMHQQERDMVLRSMFPAKLVEDYLSLIKGRTELNRLINSSNPDGLFIRTLTYVAKCLSFIESKIRPYRSK